MKLHVGERQGQVRQGQGWAHDLEGMLLGTPATPTPIRWALDSMLARLLAPETALVLARRAPGAGGNLHCTRTGQARPGQF